MSRITAVIRVVEVRIVVYNNIKRDKESSRPGDDGVRERRRVRMPCASRHTTASRKKIGPGRCAFVPTPETIYCVHWSDAYNIFANTNGRRLHRDNIIIFYS